jgi:hypothetical protein
MPSDYRLSELDVEFARLHIEHYYSSDFYPDVLEFEAIWAGWDYVKDQLCSKDVTTMGEPPLAMAAPKSGGGYRVVHQLHPFDALVYTAMAHQIAKAIEQRRVAKDDGVVCSYRIELDEETGGFFDNAHDGYKAFHDRSVSLMEDFGHVLSLDIASFYNHIYLHRLQNSLERCGAEFMEFSHVAEEFLLNLNQRQSVGIPIGPAASIVFSEALLIDVDDFLRDELPNIEYVRYVDDFRFFANSKCDLEEVHHRLTTYLHRAHRLTLASGKCFLLTSSEFESQVLKPPEDAESEALRDEVKSLIEDTHDGAYGFDEDDDEEDEDISWDEASDEARREALRHLLDRVVSSPKLDVGLARHLLRRARRSKIRAILPQVLEYAHVLLPVFRDVGLYLGAVLNAKVIIRNLERFEALTVDERFSVPYARHWLNWLFAIDPAFAESKKIEQFIMRQTSDIRAQAAFARTNRKESWVKNRKENWNQLAPWDRRGLLLAGCVLATKERNVWMDSVSQSFSDQLDILVAKFVRANTASNLSSKKKHKGRAS